MNQPYKFPLKFDEFAKALYKDYLKNTSKKTITKDEFIDLYKVWFDAYIVYINNPLNHFKINTSPKNNSHEIVFEFPDFNKSIEYFKNLHQKIEKFNIRNSK